MADHFSAAYSCAATAIATTTTPESASVHAQLALAEAVLALADEQRTANLLALAALGMGPGALNARTAAVQRLGLG